MKNGVRFTEQLDRGAFTLELDKVFYKGRSEFQDILIAHSNGVGTFLALDNILNSSECDAGIYHESIVHPCMVTLENPERALVIGGGEGSTVKELLKYEGLRIDWVEIDNKVIEKSREFLPYALKEVPKRVNLVIGDGLRYLRDSKEKYDLIIADLTDVNGDATLANELYSDGFANDVRSRLTDQGIYVTLGWEKMNGKWRYRFSPKYLKDAFDIVRPMHFYMPSFMEDFGLVVASKKRDPLAVSTDEIRRKIAKFANGLEFYDENTHELLFRVTKFHRRNF